ncbi:MAG TPA: hypothetical protein VGN09_17735 [Vicinamibacteria bacterium]
MSERVGKIGRLVQVGAPLMLLCLVAATVSAQPFEDVFGPVGASDQGARRVTPVSACPGATGGGFIAVGTTVAPGTVPDVLVVRTDATGATLWERTYDIGPGRADYGQALAEAKDGSGFVITGLSAGPGTGLDVLLMKIDCAGVPLWARTYFGPAALSEAGFDVVEARTGTATLGTRPGDILVAGLAINPANGTRDSVLMRTRSDGTMIWNQRYNISTAHEFFRALTEASPTPGTGATGDVVGVGLFAFGTTVWGYAVRVNGNTGLIGAAPQGAAVYGGVDVESFESVVELQAAPLAGNLVMVGSTRSPATASDIWAVRTGPSPAALLAQRRIGVPATAPLGEEVALDVNELTNPLAIAPPGRLALTGHAGRPGTTADDAFLLVVDQASLAPLGTGRLFGDHAGLRDWGVSVHDHATGFIIAGFSESNLEGSAPPDPRDLYLINTDPSGRTRCSRDWDVPSLATQFRVVAIPQPAIPFLQTLQQPVTSVLRDTRIPVCP